MALNPYALSMFFTAAVSGALAAYAWWRRATAGGTTFALTMVAVTIWAAGYGFELASLHFGAMRAWVVIEYIGIVTAPVFWFLFTLYFSGWSTWLKPGYVALLFVIPALTLVLNATNEQLHYLLYSAVALDVSGPIPLLALTRGPWYWVNVVYAYALILGGAVVLGQLWLHTPALYRRQATLLLIGACVPLVVNVAYMLGLRPFDHLDLSPLAFTITGLVVAFAIFRYRLFDLSPIARNSLFEELRDPVLVIDAQGRLVDLNGAARRALGPDLRIDPRRTAAANLATWPALAALCADGAAMCAELTLPTAPRSIFDVVHAPLRDHRGRPAGQIIVLRDITERKLAEAERLQLERQVQHTQKLESLGILAGGIAHDFNNLLMAILGNIELARFELSPDAPARDALGDAERAARRAADLTRQLLAYAGKGRFVIGPVDLSRLVDEITQLLRVSVGKLITFDLQLAPALDPIEGDAAQLQQIVLNLITNASEAIGRGNGRITLTTGRRSCSAADLARSRLDKLPEPGEFVYLTVADTGAGMDGVALERLFEPFFSTKDFGRGLGMSAVLGIVRSHGGAIMVDSTPGEGTTISVLFPLQSAVELPPAPEQFPTLEPLIPRV